MFITSFLSLLQELSNYYFAFAFYFRNLEQTNVTYIQIAPRFETAWQSVFFFH